ncbi:hypothetical protein OEZ86_000920 [Tetradesmus obliquus]|nr:hypothetical protein OEZ86_000920 [Tetradesmus obliquus]
MQALLRDVRATPGWGKDRDLVAIIKNVTERQTEASRAAAAQARAVEEAVRTEAARALAIAQIVAVGVSGVQQLQAGAAVLAGAGQLGGGNMQQLQALPGGRMNAEEVGEEVGGEN